MGIGVLLSLAGSGLLVGFVSGLVGIGGGVLIVPLLYLFYANAAWAGIALPHELQPVVAHATSLFVIVPTSLLGTWTYHRAGAVAWRAALPIAGFSMVAAVAVAQVAPLIPGDLLRLGFGLLLLGSGTQLLRSRRGGLDRPRPHMVVGAAAGIAVGAMSALLGVGGGIIAIPILIYLVGVDLDKVAATSMAIIVFTATAAVVGYAFAGKDVVGLPTGAVGYVHYMAGLPILAGSMLAVRSGAKLNQRLDNRRLRRLFGVVFLVMGVRLVAGSVGWLL